MRLDDTLRQEFMPEMVYSLCKLAKTGYKEAELRRYITLDGSEDSKDRFKKVLDYSLDWDFLNQNDDGIITPKFSEEELSDFRHFRYAVFKNIFHERDTKFTKAAKWFVAQDFTDVSSKILDIDRYDRFELLPIDGELSLGENYYNGFKFWMTALGLTSANANQRTVPLLPTCHKVLIDWLEFSKPFNTDTNYRFRGFLEKLLIDCPVFVDCVDLQENRISSSLTMALRVMNSNGYIKLERVNDANDVWSLSSSINSAMDEVTDITILGRCING